VSIVDQELKKENEELKNQCQLLHHKLQLISNENMVLKQQLANISTQNHKSKQLLGLLLNDVEIMMSRFNPDDVIGTCQTLCNRET